MDVSRRRVLRFVMGGLLLSGQSRFPHALAAEELKVPDNMPTDKFDCESSWACRAALSLQ